MGESFENLGPRWYVVHTYSGYENKVKANIEKIVENRNLQDTIFEIKVPVEVVESVTEKGRKESEEKLFHGYVFVKMCMSDHSWHIVRNIGGVTGFVGPGSKPVPLSEEEVAQMGVETRTVTLEYGVGDGVKIRAGYLAGTIGVVKSISDDMRKVTVVASMFGRETPIEVGAEELEKLKL